MINKAMFKEIQAYRRRGYSKGAIVKALGLTPGQWLSILPWKRRATGPIVGSVWFETRYLTGGGRRFWRFMRPTGFGGFQFPRYMIIWRRDAGVCSAMGSNTGSYVGRGSNMNRVKATACNPNDMNYFCEKSSISKGEKKCLAFRGSLQYLFVA